MTIAQLKKLIENVPDEMRVVYNYDTGNGFPELEHGYVGRPYQYHGAEVYILDEWERDGGDLIPDGEEYR